METQFGGYIIDLKVYKFPLCITNIDGYTISMILWRPKIFPDDRVNGDMFEDYEYTKVFHIDRSSRTVNSRIVSDCDLLIMIIKLTNPTNKNSF